MKNDVFKIFLFSKESGSWIIKVKDTAKWILGAGGLVFFILIVCLLLKNSLTSPTRRKRTWNGKMETLLWHFVTYFYPSGQVGRLDRNICSGSNMLKNKKMFCFINYLNQIEHMYFIEWENERKIKDLETSSESGNTGNVTITNCWHCHLAKVLLSGFGI